MSITPIWPHFKKGWPESDKPVHFFWGLGDNQTEKIVEVSAKGEEWWYVDLGYIHNKLPDTLVLSYTITIRPYFRIVKGEIHTIRGRVGDGKRVLQLEHKGIDVKFKGWYTGPTEHILLCPSSETVTRAINIWANKNGLIEL